MTVAEALADASSEPIPLAYVAYATAGAGGLGGIAFFMPFLNAGSESLSCMDWAKQFPPVWMLFFGCIGYAVTAVLATRPQPKALFLLAAGFLGIGLVTGLFLITWSMSGVDLGRVGGSRGAGSWLMGMSLIAGLTGYSVMITRAHEVLGPGQEFWDTCGQCQGRALWNSSRETFICASCGASKRGSLKRPYWDLP